MADLRDPDFVRVTLADLIVRSAYQMGKTPLLPIFAATLGATDLLLGVIVSVSTMTGMIAKPLIGAFSDRWGRKLWLLIGTAFFTLIPFGYWSVSTPEQLVIIRVIHGMATAVYGPVTLAYVAEHDAARRGEKLGWFSNARSAGYVIGPAIGGLLLLWFSPQIVFTVIGILSCLAFWPIVGLSEPSRQTMTKRQGLWPQQIWSSIKNSSRSSAVWLAGGIEAIIYVGLYALRAFLPIFALTAGWNPAEIGLFFAVQEASNIVFKPWGGRLADRKGKQLVIAVGLVGLACTLPLVALAGAGWQLLLLAGLIGFWQAVLFPATLALIADQTKGDHLGAGMGMVGTLRNGGKVAGPVLGGILLARFSFVIMFLLLSVVLLGAAVLLSLGQGWFQFDWGDRSTASNTTGD